MILHVSARSMCIFHVDMFNPGVRDMAWCGSHKRSAMNQATIMRCKCRARQNVCRRKPGATCSKDFRTKSRSNAMPLHATACTYCSVAHVVPAKHAAAVRFFFELSTAVNTHACCAVISRDWHQGHHTCRIESGSD